MFLYNTKYKKHASEVYNQELETMESLRNELVTPYSIDDMVKHSYELWAIVYPFCHLLKFAVNLCKLVMTSFNLLFSLADEKARNQAFDIWSKTLGALSLNIINFVLSFVSIFTKAFATLTYDYSKDVDTTITGSLRSALSIPISSSSDEIHSNTTDIFGTNSSNSAWL